MARQLTASALPKKAEGKIFILELTRQEDDGIFGLSSPGSEAPLQPAIYHGEGDPPAQRVDGTTY